MKTIIQTIGPLYGEVVNGTVFGQPNGDIARPLPNVAPSVTLSGDSATLTKTAVSGGQIAKYDLAGMAASFVNADSFAYNKMIVYDSTNQAIATGSYPSIVMQGPANLIPTDGDSLTLKMELKDTYGNTLFTSEALTLTAVVPS